jgi:malonyl-CoA O-methyltransferase
LCPEPGLSPARSISIISCDASRLPALPISARLEFMSHSFQNTSCIGSTGSATVFLPGWAFDGRILELIKPLPTWIYPGKILDPQTIDQELLQLAAEKNVKKIRLIGWSMGAMLGVIFAARYPNLIDSLLLVSLRSQWPDSEIEALRTEFRLDPAAFLKDFYRKCFLGDKQAYRNFSKGLEHLYLAEIDKNFEQLLQTLDFLASFKVPGRLPELPIRLIHGRQDRVAPLTDMPTISGAEVEIIENGGHAPFLHQSCSLQHEFGKQVIQQKFSRAADTYDNYAKVQAEVAGKLAVKLPKQQCINNILEIGCGTGNFTSMLAARFPGAKIVALDFSPEMLTLARRKLQGPNLEFICAEGEQFLEDAREKSFDLVVSNGSLQWFTHLDRSLHDISRILVPGGFIVCSIFGPQSLTELGKGLRALKILQNSLAAQTFPDLDELRRQLHASIPESNIEEEFIKKEYRSVHDLLHHIKKTGTGGWRQKLQHPLTPSRVGQLEKWFINTYGSCRVTYQVFFLQGKVS